jgi:hypothetical protein
MNTSKGKSTSVWPMFIGVIAIIVLGFVFNQVLGNLKGLSPTQIPMNTLSPTAPPKDPTLAPAPPTIEPIAFPTGLFDGGGDAFYSGDVTIQNYWQNIVNGETVQVFAGALYQDPEQGLVIVVGLSPSGRYYTPTRAGSVRITAENNLRLTLISANGATFYFDLPSHQFVNSLEVTVMPTKAVAESLTPTIPNVLSPHNTPSSSYP